MKILDVLNSAWAIVPDKLCEITEIYSRHLRGEKVDWSAISAQLAKPAQHVPKGYSMVAPGVAYLPIEGVLAKRMNLMMQFSGGTSMQHATRDFNQALADPSVSSIILGIDSPGGTVDGTQEVARAVMAARSGDKPVVAWVDGMMASAAYWIGSAADAVYVGADTDLVGSIGVAMQHVDYSGADAKNGIKRTDIYSGQYKRIASDTGPLTEAGREYLQQQSDYYYSLFVETVAQHRGVSVEQVLSDMADGRLFIGRQAIDAGLVDGASTLDALIADLTAGAYQRKRSAQQAAAGVAEPVVLIVLPDAPQVTSSNPTSAGDAPIIKPSIYEESMDIKTLKEKHPDVAQALIDEGFAAGQTAGRTEGATAERERIQSVEAQAMPGHEALVATLKFDGKTTGPEAAMQVLAAERAKKPAQLAALRSDAPSPAPATPSASGDQSSAEGSDNDLPLEARAERDWKASAKLQEEFKHGGLKSYIGYLKHEAAKNG